MEEKTKQRLIGVLVLVGALFIILPFLFHNSRPSLNSQNASNTATNPTVSLPMSPANTPTTAQDNNAPSNENPAAVAAPSTAQVPANQTAGATTSANTPAVITDNQNPVATTAANITSPAVTPTPSAPTPTITATTTLSATTTAAAPSQPAAAVSPALLGSASAVTTGKSDPQFQAQAAASNDTVMNAQPAAAIASPIEKLVHHASHRRSAGASGWTIQLAVFSNPKNAHELMTKLRHHHFEAYGRSIKHNDTTLTAVFVGPEMSMQKAESIKQTLQRDFRLHGVVKKYHV